MEYWDNKYPNTPTLRLRASASLWQNDTSHDQNGTN